MKPHLPPLPTLMCDSAGSEWSPPDSTEQPVTVPFSQKRMRDEENASNRQSTSQSPKVTLSRLTPETKRERLSLLDSVQGALISLPEIHMGLSPAPPIEQSQPAVNGDDLSIPKAVGPLTLPKVDSPALDNGSLSTRKGIVSSDSLNNDIARLIPNGEASLYTELGGYIAINPHSDPSLPQPIHAAAGSNVDTLNMSHSSSTSPRVRDIGDEITFDSIEPVDTRGHFCDLFMGSHRTVGKVALKRLRHRGGGEGDIEITMRHFTTEKDIWMSLRHDRILQCLGMFMRECHLYLVSPFMKNGSLFDWIRSGEHAGLERLRVIHELADALVYLHRNGIVHGDVKSNNVLISDNFHVQLCDFGLTKLAEANTTTTLKGAGSVRWQSPELWNNTPKTFASDVYAFAMTIVEVLTSQMPFAAILHDTAVVMAVHLRRARPALSPKASPDGMSYSNPWLVAELCRRTDPTLRLSMAEAFRQIGFCMLNSGRTADRRLPE